MKPRKNKNLFVAAFAFILVLGFQNCSQGFKSLNNSTSLNLPSTSSQGAPPVVNPSNSARFVCDQSQISKSSMMKLTEREYVKTIFSFLDGFTATLKNDPPLVSLLTGLESDIIVEDKNYNREQYFLLTGNMVSSYLEVAFRSGALVSAGTRQMTCTLPATPNDPAGYLQKIPIFLNLQALAFKCGLTKLATFEFDGESHYDMPGVPAGSYFHAILYGTSPGITTAQSYDIYTTWMKRGYEQVGAQFLAPLNVEEGSTGRTYLDNMVTVMLSEGGSAPDSDDFGHINANYQPVIIGSMAGTLRGNRYYHLPHVGDGTWSRMDLPYNAFSMTLMKLMGVPANEYQAFTVDGKGYGLYGKDHNGGVIPASLVAKGYVPISEILT